MSSRGAGGKAKKSKQMTRSKRAGVVFPVARIHRYLKKATLLRTMKGAPVYLAAVLEYLSGKETFFILSDCDMIAQFWRESMSRSRRGALQEKHFLKNAANHVSLLAFQRKSWNSRAMRHGITKEQESVHAIFSLRSPPMKN